jgi:hypothetical protein
VGTHFPDEPKDLQEKIRAWCEDHGYLYWHDRSRGCNIPGLPDVLIWGKGRRHVLIQLKIKKGKLSGEQIHWRKSLLLFGFEWHECRSWRKFLQIMNHAPGTERGNSTQMAQDRPSQSMG